MIDSHCHFDFEAFDRDRPALLEQCAAADINALIIPGVEPKQWQALVSLVAQLRSGVSQHSSACNVFMALGLHPWWVLENPVDQDQFKALLSSQLKLSGAIAIGECGLDGSLALSIAAQLPVFEWHVQLASDAEFPLIIHSHKAHNEVIALLSRYRPRAGGVIHGFSGSFEQAQQYWKLGFYLGVGGTITYERANKTRRALAQMPLESLLLETDAPDMPLKGYQGQPNTPLRLPLVAQTLAQLRGERLNLVASKTHDNTQRLFPMMKNTPSHDVQ